MRIKKEENLLETDTSVVKRKTRQRQATGLAEPLSCLEEIFQAGGDMSSFPFEESIIEETEEYIVVQRSFDKNLGREELVWHRDKEDREICVIEGEGWYLQFDNELPNLMQKNVSYKIPSETWHRIINTNETKLLINVRKYK